MGMGAGSSVWRTWPLIFPEISVGMSVAASLDMGVGKIAGLRVLIVDDDPVCARLLRAVLETEWCAVTIVTSLADAMQGVDGCRPEVVMVRLEVAHGAGLDLVKDLRAYTRLGRLALLGMTGNTTRYSECVALEAGCDALLVLPLDTRGLASTIADAMAQRAAS